MRALLAAVVILLSLAATRPADAVQTSKINLNENLGNSYEEIRHRRWHRVKKARRSYVRHSRHHRARYHARHHRRAAAKVRGANVVAKKTGASARVHPRHAKQFQCLVNGLEAVGYRIDFMGGYGSRSFAQSKHPLGLALDINQTSRNIVTRRLPGGTSRMAARCGLLHGAVWRHADGGHFEIPGGRFARKEWPRVVKTAAAKNKIPQIDILREAMPIADLKNGRKLPLPDPEVFEPVYARIEEEMLGSLEPAVDENGFLPPIRPQDRVNIFKAYEAGILRPVGNCKEFERVDQRIRRVVSDAAQHFGGVALAYSCYRDAKHNRRVGGARKSMHVQRKALDFTVRVKEGLVNKLKLAMWVRKHPLMAKVGGVGIYCGNGIHADVGGKRNWNWCGTLLADGTHAKKGKRKGNRYAQRGKKRGRGHG